MHGSSGQPNSRFSPTAVPVGRKRVHTHTLILVCEEGKVRK